MTYVKYMCRYCFKTNYVLYRKFMIQITIHRNKIALELYRYNFHVLEIINISHWYFNNSFIFMNKLCLTDVKIICFIMPYMRFQRNSHLNRMNEFEVKLVRVISLATSHYFCSFYFAWSVGEHVLSQSTF